LTPTLTGIAEAPATRARTREKLRNILNQTFKIACRIAEKRGYEKTSRGNLGKYYESNMEVPTALSTSNAL
jgi:hypothetical protein